VQIGKLWQFKTSLFSTGGMAVALKDARGGKWKAILIITAFLPCGGCFQQIQVTEWGNIPLQGAEVIPVTDAGEGRHALSNKYGIANIPFCENGHPAKYFIVRKHGYTSNVFDPSPHTVYIILIPEEYAPRGLGDTMRQSQIERMRSKQQEGVRSE
jgi:hypothetical protein